jgi:hypothetical protein
MPVLAFHLHVEFGLRDPAGRGDELGFNLPQGALVTLEIDYRFQKRAPGLHSHDEPRFHLLVATPVRE